MKNNKEELYKELDDKLSEILGKYTIDCRKEVINALIFSLENIQKDNKNGTISLQAVH